MKIKNASRQSASKLDRMALDMSDVKPMSTAMRGKWQAAKQTGARLKRKLNTIQASSNADVQSQIIPVSIESSLLSKADNYAKTAGISRSRLITEALRLQIGHSA